MGRIGQIRTVSAAQLAQKVEKVLRGLEPGSPEWKEAAALNEQLRRPQGAEHGES